MIATLLPRRGRSSGSSRRRGEGGHDYDDGDVYAPDYVADGADAADDDDVVPGVMGSSREWMRVW